MIYHDLPIKDGAFICILNYLRVNELRKTGTAAVDSFSRLGQSHKSHGLGLVSPRELVIVLYSHNQVCSIMLHNDFTLLNDYDYIHIYIHIYIYLYTIVISLQLGWLYNIVYSIKYCLVISIAVHSHDSIKTPESK